VARPRPHLQSDPSRAPAVGALPTHDAEGRPFLRVQTLGAASILVGDVRIGAPAGTLFSLLLRMCFAPGCQVSRRVLKQALWPDQEALRQSANLRQALYKLRGYGLRIGIEGDTVVLDMTQVVPTFCLSRSAEYFARDVMMGHEPFGLYLSGFSASWAAMQDWIEEQRGLVHSDVRRVLSEQLRGRRSRADWGGADALARWLLQFDPLNEEATLTVAECTALSGSKSEALAILDRYLAELGPTAGDIRLPAALLRRRIAEPATRGRLSFATTERHFIGRQEELAALTLSMRRARWHDGSAVLLHGTAGMGKSRLVYELTKVAAIEGVRVAHTASRESDMLRPLSVFLDLVPELLAQPGAIGCAPESLAALKRLVPVERPDLTSMSASATGSNSTFEASSALEAAGDTAADRAFPNPRDDARNEVSDESAVTAVEKRDFAAPQRAASTAGEPTPMVASLRRAIIDLVSAISEEKPTLLLVDDVHWIDEHSWDVLSDLIERCHALRVFVLLTSRVPHARLQRPQRTPVALRVEAIMPLSAESCLQLSRAIGDDLSAPIDDSLGEWFMRASEGVPLFLRALVNHWIETGQAGGVPPTLQGVIEQRLSQLSGDGLRVLQTASLLGKWATVERVGAVLELRLVTLLQALDEIAKVGALVPSQGAVIVAHELLTHAACAMQNPVQRYAIHRSAARLLLQEGSSTLDPDAVVAALDHYFDGGDLVTMTAKTLEHLETIATHRLPASALRCIGRVNTHRLSNEQKGAIECAIARLMLSAGEYSNAMALPLRGFRIPVLQNSTSESQVDAALSLVDSSYRADPLVETETLLKFTLDTVELDQFAQTTRLRAADIGLVIASDACSAEYASRLFRALKLTNEEQYESNRACRVAILFHTLFGDMNAAALMAGKLTAQAQKEQPSAMTFQDALRAGFALRIVSKGREHLDALMLAYDLATAIEAPLRALSAAWQLAQSYLELGEKDAAECWVTQARGLVTQIDVPIEANFANALFCRFEIEYGNRGQAQAFLEQYLVGLPRIPSIKAAAYSLSLSIAVRLLEPTWVPTDELLATMLARHQIVRKFGTCDYLTSVSSEALFRAGARSEAAALIDEYLSNHRREVRSLGHQLATSCEHFGISRDSAFGVFSKF